MNKTEDKLCSWIYLFVREREKKSVKDHFFRLDDRSSSSA